MVCPNCNTTIDDNSTSCPNCGVQFNTNTGMINNNQPEMVNNNQTEIINTNQEVNNTNVNNSDEDVVIITENMAPPELAVNQENMMAGVGDLSSGASMSSYAPVEKTEEVLEDNNAKIPDRVDFAIPKVTAPDTSDTIPDGSVPVIGEQTTILTEEDAPKKDVTNIKVGGKVLKIKTGKNLGLPMVLVIAVLTLIIGIFLGKMLFSKNYCTTTTRKTNNVEKVKFVADGKNNKTNVGSFTYKIPENYIYDKTAKGLLVYDKKDTFRIYIKTTNGSYENMSGAKLSIKETLKENGTTVNNIKELNIESKNYLIIETVHGMSNRLIAFSDASHDYVYYIEIVSSSNNYEYDILDIAADIVKNAEYQEVMSKMEDISVNDVSDIAIKASLEYKALNKN